MSDKCLISAATLFDNKLPDSIKSNDIGTMQ